jgi:hypothetical protein
VVSNRTPTPPSPQRTSGGEKGGAALWYSVSLGRLGADLRGRRRNAPRHEACRLSVTAIRPFSTHEIDHRPRSRRWRSARGCSRARPKLALITSGCNAVSVVGKIASEQFRFRQAAGRCATTPASLLDCDLELVALKEPRFSPQPIDLAVNSRLRLSSRQCC